MEMRDKTTRRIAYSTNSVILIVLLFGILAMVNYFFSNHFTRIDLTEKKEYSISSSTKGILNDLSDIITIKAYFSNELPPRVAPIRAQVQDLLEEFAAYSKGNVRYEFIDPGDDPAMTQELRFAGIPQVQLNVIENDKAELMNAYLGIMINFADKKEVIPFLRNTANLEYELASIIVKLTTKENENKVGFINGNKEENAEELYKGLTDTLRKQYNFQLINLDDNKPIPEDVVTLIFAHPEGVTEYQKFLIDQFVMRGGKLILLIDPVKIQQGQLQALNIKTNMGDLLNQYGLKMEDGLVVDVRSNEMGAFSMGYVTYQTSYPYWPKVPKGYFSQDNPAVSQLETLVLPWTASVKYLEDRENISGQILARSSEFAYTMKEPYNLNPQQPWKRDPSEMSSLPLAASVSGPFKSLFAGKDIPPIVTDGEEGEKVPGTFEGERLDEGKPTTIILVASANFIQDNFVRMFRGGAANLVFVSNLVDWLTLGDKLISIRSRSIVDRPLAEMTEGTKSVIRFMNIFGVSLLVIIIGLVRLFIKKRSQKLYANLYG